MGGTWVPLSKGQKGEMRQLLTAVPFPELAVVADSGQKHIWFRARRNPAGATAGWVQFEEEQVWVEPELLRQLLAVFEELMLGFGKGQIESGEYYPQMVLQFGFGRWQRLEKQIKPYRGGVLLKLVSFLAQKPEEDLFVPEPPTAVFASPPKATKPKAPQPQGQLTLF
jgi:hypothetical protein